MGLCVSGCVKVSLGVLGGLIRYLGVSLMVIVMVIYSNCNYNLNYCANDVLSFIFSFSKDLLKGREYW